MTYQGTQSTAHPVFGEVGHTTIPVNTMPETLSFEVYRDDSMSEYGEPTIYAVLTNPAPNIPKDTLSQVQQRVTESDCFEGLSDGEGIENAGEVTYSPDRESGEVLSITIHD